jgi:N-carbamoyl-L-amino-acid hydrolase
VGEYPPIHHTTYHQLVIAHRKALGQLAVEVRQRVIQHRRPAAPWTPADARELVELPPRPGTESPGDLACYMELHIEQGGLLEKAGLQIGVVEGIVGLRWFEITVTGFANHAGTTPMDQRQDAMLAAAKFAVAINDAVRGVPGRTVATIGRMVVSPNTTNVIPGQVVFTVDLRDLDAAKIARFTERFAQLGREIGAATKTTFDIKQSVDTDPAISDPQVMSLIDGAAAALGFTRQRMPSGAGHDAQEMSRIAPMAMIFVPSVGGISHSPKEFTKPEDVVNGADVLLNAVVAADRGSGGA